MNPYIWVLNRGIERDAQQGMQQDVYKNKPEIRSILKTMNMPVAGIAKITGLPIEDIKKR